MDRLEVDYKLTTLLEDFSLEEMFERFDLEPTRIFMFLWEHGLIDEEGLG